MYTSRILKWTFSFLFILTVTSTVYTQAPKRMTSGEIHQAIKKLRVLGSALYVAAHPDDENTRLISYLSNELNVHTTYLSMTRGDGGQNLVGPEIRELLGLIRTQELMMARKIDGGHQRFTRANDFGYSKSPEETLDFWNKDDVLSDVVWAIRTLQPDIIVNRFPHEHITRNHGHHTASGMLSFEAFDLAAKRSVYPEQFEYVDPWQPQRLFFNTSWWFYGSRENFDKADKSRLAGVDVGVYYPILGLSNTEIAAQSRSMHKSQGFGASGTRGSQTEYLELLKGDMPDDKTDLFDGIDITWNRVKGGQKIDAVIAEVEEAFDYRGPELSVPGLVLARQLIMDLEPSVWKKRKLHEVEVIIQQCLGLFAEVLAEDYWATPGDSIELNCEVTNRSAFDLQLTSATFNGLELLDEPMKCASNEPVRLFEKVRLSPDLDYSSPYWLKEEWSEGMYAVDDQMLRGLPENPQTLGITFTFNITGQPVSIFKPVVYKRTDPVKGEVYRPFDVVPPAFINLSDEVMVFGDQTERPISVTVKSATEDVRGKLRIAAEDGWVVTPAEAEISLENKGDEQVVTFMLLPPADQQIAHLSAELMIGDRTTDLSLLEITYDHIPTQTILRPATSKVVKVDLKRAGNRIGYIMGAGDEVPSSLEQVGYEVDLLDENQVNLEMLRRYDAVILGVRTYNTSNRIRHIQPALFSYVKQGGTLITQYNTSRGLKADEVGPYPLQLSRLRVTDETASVDVLTPDHAVMHYPNEITRADFEHWVQERGLYYPDEWNEAYTPVLRMADPGEDAVDGSLLIAEYGDGHFIYTGISWFRQLPAGVPGAFRLFTNLISLGRPSRS